MSAGCKRSCCWVPMEGVCARQHTCKCHAETYTPHWTEKTPAQVQAAVEQASREESARMKEWSSWR